MVFVPTKGTSAVTTIIRLSQQQLTTTHINPLEKSRDSPMKVSAKFMLLTFTLSRHTMKQLKALMLWKNFREL